jgi:hydrogenase maturation protease
MLDEGVGVKVAELLIDSFDFGETVEILDAGTMGYGMMHLFRDRDYMLVIDAINGTGLEPGTVVRVSPEQFAPNQVLHSLHDVRLPDVLSASALIGITLEVECIGIQIADMSPEGLSIGLTDAVQGALPRAIAAALYMLRLRGYAADAKPDGDSELQTAVAAEFADLESKHGPAS